MLVVRLAPLQAVAVEEASLEAILVAGLRAGTPHRRDRDVGPVGLLQLWVHRTRPHELQFARQRKGQVGGCILSIGILMYFWVYHSRTSSVI